MYILLGLDGAKGSFSAYLPGVYLALYGRRYAYHCEDTVINSSFRHSEDKLLPTVEFHVYKYTKIIVNEALMYCFSPNIK